MSLDNFYLARPGADEIQLDLFGDYKSNVALYPAFQNYFRTHKPPFLAVWGKNDPFFLPPGAEAFKRDIPGAAGALLRYRPFRAGDACRGDRGGHPRLPRPLTASSLGIEEDITCRTSVAIVTGASQGIGRSTAIRLARDFSSVVLAARDRPNLEKTAEAVKAAGAEPLVIDIDLSEASAAKSVVDQTLSAFGRIDALLNIAGAVPRSTSSR